MPRKSESLAYKRAQLVWQKCLRFIKENVTESEYETIFKHIKPYQLEDNHLILALPSDFIREYLDTRYAKLLAAAIESELGNKAQISYIVDIVRGKGRITLRGPVTQGFQTQQQENPSYSLPYTLYGEVPSPYVIPGLMYDRVESRLIPEYTFENFIESASNRSARLTARFIATHPESRIFPFYIYGPSGVGKTHLGHAIGNEVQRLFPKKNVYYISAGEFVTHYTSATRNQQVNDFQYFYDVIDTLIIDDFQELASKEGSIRAFLAILKRYEHSGKQLIIIADKAPSDLVGFNEAVINTIKNGIAEELPYPDFETRKAILKHKSAMQGIQLSDEIIDFIASKLTNGRELNGVLSALLIHQIQQKKPISMEMVRSIIRHYLQQHKKQITIELIMQVVAKHFNLKPEELRSQSRTARISLPRQLAMYLAREHTGMSFQSIGHYFNRKDHSTVIYACNRIKDALEVNKELRSIVEKINKALLG